MLQQEQYKIALSYFSEATRLHETKLYDGINGQTRETFGTHTTAVRTTEAINRVLRRENFILACRFFNKGLAKLALLQQIQNKEHFEEEDIEPN